AARQPDSEPICEKPMVCADAPTERARSAAPAKSILVMMILHLGSAGRGATSCLISWGPSAPAPFARPDWRERRSDPPLRVADAVPPRRPPLQKALKARAPLAFPPPAAPPRT